MAKGGFAPDRRQVLAGLAATAIARPARASGVNLRAAPAKVQLAPDDYSPTEVWAFNDKVPGPVLRGQQGGRMAVAVENGLTEETSVHWHGLRLENAMDGVPGLTQAPIGVGETFAYDFRTPDAGTFWYHSHSRSFEQVARGLAGPLIVEEPEPPEVDADEVLVLDDWRLEGDAVIMGGFGAVFDLAHGGRIGNWVTVNGSGEWQQTVPRGARVRLRLINTANGRIFQLRLAGMAAWIVALDGQPVPRPLATDTLTLAPAQRIDLIVDVTAEDGGEALILSRERDGDFAIASFPVLAGQAPRVDPVEALPPNQVPVPSGAGRRDAPVRTLNMAGGAMGQMQSARIGDEDLDARSLAARGMVWAFNGMSGMPDAPFAEVKQGEVLRINLVNDTAWPHAMHLHGHHFLTSTGRLRDTTLVPPRGRQEIAFIADNPGDWLMHCHMLDHAASGMMTWFRVV